MTETVAVRRGREADIELLRLTACLAVITIHASGFSGTGCLLVSGAAEFSVPLFVLISGYGLLSRERTPAEMVRRAGRTLCLTLLWSGIYYLLDILHGLRAYGGIRDAAAFLFSGPYHLWYLWMAMGLYLLTPLLSVFHRRAAPGTYRYALVLTFFTGSLLVLTLRAGVSPALAQVAENCKLPLRTAFVCTFLAGGYLRKYPPEYPGRLAAAGAAALLFTLAWPLAAPAEQRLLILNGFGPSCILTAVGLFAAVRMLYPWLPDRLRGWESKLMSLAACTRGVYLIHHEALRQLGLWAPWMQSLPVVLRVPMKVGTVFCGSAAIVWLARKVPLLRKVL